MRTGETRYRKSCWNIRRTQGFLAISWLAGQTLMEATMKCDCNRLRIRVRESNVTSSRPTRKLIAKCMDCSRSYVCIADNREFGLLLQNSAIKIN